ncbi:hypothetical protein HPP92_006285 [Vanilla planifolia]|uniref:DUF7792 domain-containing protein n=1 Tax=Vanilla planifolia TaxID=51239 RepID=A0A835RW68_VANPL|nr:hypothetical protein HPP92_006285 [Vanilla planifolia]
MEMMESACRRGRGGEEGMEDELRQSILVAEHVKKAAAEAECFRSECAEIGRKVNHLASMLRSETLGAAAVAPAVYHRPFQWILAEANKVLFGSLFLLRKFRRSGLFRRVVYSAVFSSNFRGVLSAIDSSLANLPWLISLYSGSGVVVGLIPSSSIDPLLSRTWSRIATIEMASTASDRAEAAVSLANFAIESSRNNRIIVEEGGVPPLLSLLSDDSSVDAQVAATAALHNVACDPDHIFLLLEERTAPLLVHLLSISPMILQSRLASLISRMASHPLAREEFARESAVRPLIALLSFELPLDESNPSTKIQSLDTALNHSSSTPAPAADKESPELKHALKVACSEAIWKLSIDSPANKHKIAETNGLLCLAKLIEVGKGDLQHNCLMAVVEFATAAETDVDLRRAAFKANSPTTKSVADQLLRVANQGGSNISHVAAAIQAIGSLARAFSASEIGVLRTLVIHLEHWDRDVAAEAAIALGKFVCSENYNCTQNAKAIVEFGGVRRSMRLLRPGEKTMIPALRLLCYLSLYAAGSEAFERTMALSALESLGRAPGGQHPLVKDLLRKAVDQLELHVGGPSTLTR